MTTYLKLSDGSYLTYSDGSYSSSLPDIASDTYNALYVQWVEEGMPVFFKYGSLYYMRTTEPDIEFIEILRGRYPESEDVFHLWDGLYGPYGRISNQVATIPSPTFTTLSLSDGSIMTFDNGHTVEITT